MRSLDELKDAAGYTDRHRDFDELLRILDRELRLITPADPEGGELEGEDDAPDHDRHSKYFQLTHDYLVPSLREWLTRKQRETRRGRAELRLAERAALWNVKPENRHLPSVGETLRISLLTDRNHWTEPQMQMMQAARRFHLTRWSAAVVLLAVIGVSIQQIRHVGFRLALSSASR